MARGIIKNQQVKIKNAMIDGVKDIDVIAARCGLGEDSYKQVKGYMDAFAEDEQVILQGKLAKVRRDRAAELEEGITEFHKETADMIAQVKDGKLDPFKAEAEVAKTPKK